MVLFLFEVSGFKNNGQCYCSLGTEMKYRTNSSEKVSQATWKPKWTFALSRKM